MKLPRYPVYVISKGRAARCLTARFLLREGTPFRLVVEPQEAEAYAAHFPEQLLLLPFSNLGLGSIPARNWVWEHARAAGAERHWILDDNINEIRRQYRGRRIPCDSGPALAAVEDFVDRYENVPVAGLQYQMFGFPGIPPFSTNVHVYSCLLIENAAPMRWRGRYNEDTDLCLQVLAAGLCTVLVNVFQVFKVPSMQMSGGNTDELYAGDGRLKMARALEQAWPGVVQVKRRYGRPQHVVSWGRFDTPLKLKPGIDLSALPKVDERGLAMSQIRPIRNPRVGVVRDEYARVGDVHDRSG